MTKRICISGYYGFGNFGDETILKILTENLKSADKNIEITVFSVNPNNTSKELGVKSVNTFNLIEILSSILYCNYLISGGGSLLQDTTSKKSLLYYLFVIIIAELFQKKVIIFAQGIGPINNNLLKKLTMFLLKRAIYITVRDDESLKLLNDYGVKNIYKCADPVWNIDVKQDENANKIGVQLRDFHLVTEEFLKNLARNVNKYYSDREICILSLQNTLDLSICRQFEKILKKENPKIRVKVMENTSRVIEDICTLEALIAMRYHACLVGIKAGVKVLPINYDIKVETLAKEFNLKYIKLSDYDMTQIFETFVKSDIFYDDYKFKRYDFRGLIEVLNGMRK